MQGNSTKKFYYIICLGLNFFYLEVVDLLHRLIPLYIIKHVTLKDYGMYVLH